MDPSEPQREARALARPCVYLREFGDTLAGVWVPTRELLFTSAALPSPGWPSQGVFALRCEDRGPIVTFSKGLSIPSPSRGVRLYASAESSLPPVDAVFLLGSERVQAWLRDLDWPPEAGYNTNFPDRAIVEEYERLYQTELPFYTGGAHAVLGGWHLPWADGDWPTLVSAQLLAWTFGDEPWLEAWARDGRLWAVERIT